MSQSERNATLQADSNLKFNMILKPTTLILGAGASAHLGYPVGYQLLNQIIEAMRSGNAAAVPGAAELQANGSWDTFHNRLSQGGWTSPDAFLEQYNSPEFLHFGKHVIAWLLRKHEIANSLFPPKDWYLQLVSSVVTGDLAEFHKNRLSIITFNYDRSVDHLLHMLAMHRFEMSFEAAWRMIDAVIPIVHVHGMLGSYPAVAYSTDSDLSAAAAGIKIMHEFDDSTDGFCSPEFAKANAMLNSAEVIYALGFSMAETNMRRLRFFHDGVLKGRQFRAALGNVGTATLATLAGRLEQFGINRTMLSNHLCVNMFEYEAKLE